MSPQISIPHAGVTIAVKNLSTVVTDEEIHAVMPAFQVQMSRDFASCWGMDATLQIVDKKDTLPKAWWMLGVFDDSDQAGVLGYHDLTISGQPIGKVFARTSVRYAGNWSVPFSHEMLEMRGDSEINLCCFDADGKRLYAREVGDPVESQIYEINGVLVSDFVRPTWFEPLYVPSASESLAFRSVVTRPFQLLPGGYASYYDLSGGGWQQLTASTTQSLLPMHSLPMTPIPHNKRAQVGSRRERRRLPKSQWLLSTAA